MSHLETIVRVALLLGISLVAMPLLRRRSAVARRLVLSAAIVFALAIPFLPAWHVEAPVLRGIVAHVVAEPSGARDAEPAAVVPAVISRVGSIDWLRVVWVLGAIAVAARFGVGLVLAHRIARRARASKAWARAIARAESRTGLTADVRVSEEIEAPAVSGLFRPVVLVPSCSETWSEERQLSVLTHELTHVASHDLLVQAVATIVCSLHWFNPLAWLAARRLRLERELAADEAVLRAGTRASSYAEDLLAIAGAAPFGMVAIGEKPLTTRITAIVSEKRPAALGVHGASLLVLGTAGVSLAIACTSPADAPSSVTAPLSVDSDLQATADRELAALLADKHATGGTILVMTPKGEVLADAGRRTDKAYLPGSTMKPFLLSAALEEGVVSEGDTFDCSKGERAGKVLHDSSKHETLALPEILVVSSNVGFAQVFDRVGGAKLDRALRRFHFSPPEQLATQPAGDWDGALTAIGVNISVTPRQLTLGYAAIADGGDGIVKKETADRVTTMLEGVVASDHGTGTKARVPGVRVAGKTGTSSWTAADGSEMTYASFVGFVPAERPRYVIFVGVETSREDAWGGGTAAPVFSRIAQRALTRSSN